MASMQSIPQCQTAAAYWLQEDLASSPSHTQTQQRLDAVARQDGYEACVMASFGQAQRCAVPGVSTMVTPYQKRPSDHSM